MSAMKTIHKKICDIKESGQEIRKEIREKTLGYVVASFSLVAGLAWNEAIKAAIEEFFPMAKDTIKAKMIYALVLTLVVVTISVYLVRLFKSDEEKEIEKEVKKEKKKATKKQSKARSKSAPALKLEKVKVVAKDK